jgi:hypothetical protein
MRRLVVNADSQCGIACSALEKSSAHSTLRNT